jgi:putative copper export protein
LLVTGVLNFTFAGIARGFHFSTAFGAILAAKVVLFVAMTAALAAATRTSAAFRATLEEPRDTVANAMNRMMKTQGTIVALGAMALVLGLWLIGT